MPQLGQVFRGAVALLEGGGVSPFGQLAEEEQRFYADGVNSSSFPGLEVEEDDVTKGFSSFRSPGPKASGMLGHIDASYISVGHFEVLGHGLNNGVDLHVFLDSVGRPKGS